MAERLYFHRRNDEGIDREAFLSALDGERPIVGGTSKRTNPSGRRRVDRQRVHASLDLGLQHVVDHPVRRHPALAREGVRRDPDAEMAALGPVPGVPLCRWDSSTTSRLAG